MPPKLISHQTLSRIIVNLNQTTTRLAQEKTQLQSLLNNISEAVIATDTRGTILRSNPTAVRLIETSEVDTFNRPCDQILHLTDGHQTLKFKSYCSTSNHQPRPAHLQNLQLISQSQRVIPVSLSSAPITQLGIHTGWVITIHDLTAEQELEQMKRDFVSIAAHQLRTPLTTIIGYLETLKEAPLSSTQQSSVNQIDISARRLRDLVESLLNLSRIEHGTIQTHLQPTNYPQLLKQVIQDLAPHYQAKNHHLKTHIPPRIPQIALDPLQIRQVLINLLNNAIQYTPKNGTITIKLTKQPRQLTTSVTDTGPGIPLSAQKHLFTKFYRVPNPNRPTASTGLGLYLAKQLILLHHGTIRVDSQPGAGSTFSFTLPLKPA
jgi:PAS domain S-box-containing protein